MKLKTKLLLVTTVIVVTVLALSEWIAHRETAKFLQHHEARMVSAQNHAAALDELRRGRATLLEDLTVIHVLHGVLTILALVAALTLLWNRMVLSPLQELLCHVNYMGRGSWESPVPVRSNDEIGDLTNAFNALGQQLTTTVAQFAGVSKLSGMALLGQSIVRRVASARDLVRLSAELLDTPRVDADVVAPARVRLHGALEILTLIPAQFDTEFQREVEAHSRPARIPAAAAPTNEAS